MKIYTHILLDKSFQEHISGQLPHHECYFRSESGDISTDRRYFEQADYIFGNPPVAWFSEPSKKLRLLQFDSAGFDQYKHITLNARAANIGDWFAQTCAETVIGAIICLYRGIDKFVLLREKNEWLGAKLRDRLRHLHGEKVMILGAGAIGSRVRDLLKNFGCQVSSFARTSPQAEYHRRETLLEALCHVDIVINTLPGLGSYVVDGEFLCAMKQGSLYATVGRGNTTNENELIHALSSGQLGGAIMDVTEIEPLPAESALWTLPTVILTQHTAGGRANEDSGKVTLFVENVKRIEAGEDVKNEVDVKRGY